MGNGRGKKALKGARWGISALSLSLVRCPDARIYHGQCECRALLARPSSSRHSKMRQSRGFMPRELAMIMEGNYNQLRVPPAQKSKGVLSARGRLYTGSIQAFRGGFLSETSMTFFLASVCSSFASGPVLPRASRQPLSWLRKYSPARAFVRLL